MSTPIGSFSAKTHLPALLRRVEKGERIVITRHGHPIAVLSPPETEKKLTVQEAVARIRELSRHQRLGKVSLKSLIEEGRR